MTCKTCGGSGRIPVTATTPEQAWATCPTCKLVEPPDLIARANRASVVEYGPGNFCGTTNLGDLLADAIEARDAEIARLRASLAKHVKEAKP